MASAIVPCWTWTMCSHKWKCYGLKWWQTGDWLKTCDQGHLKGKGGIFGCHFLPQDMWIPAALVRHWVAMGPVWRGCLPLPLHPSAWGMSHAPFYLLSFHVVDPHVSNCRIISPSGRWCRLSLRLMCSLSVLGFTWTMQAVCLCPLVPWKTQISWSSYLTNKLCATSRYQHIQISWNRNQSCLV